MFRKGDSPFWMIASLVAGLLRLVLPQNLAVICVAIGGMRRSIQLLIGEHISQLLDLIAAIQPSVISMQLLRVEV